MKYSGFVVRGLAEKKKGAERVGILSKRKKGESTRRPRYVKHTVRGTDREGKIERELWL